MPTSKYRLVKPQEPAPVPAEDPSFLDQLKAGLDTRSLDESPLGARLRGFGAGTIEGAQGLGRGLVEAVKHPMTAAPALTRAVSGFAAAPGNLPGAVIAGGGELAAEALEGSLWNQSPLRSLLKVGTAAGIGAIPLTSTIKAGRVLPSIARSATYAGGGELAREVSAGEGVDPARIGTSSTIGGFTGGVLGKLLGLGAKPDYSGPRPVPVRPTGPRPLPPGPAKYEIQPTTQVGEGTATLGGGRLTYGKPGKPDILKGAKYAPDIVPQPIISSMEAIAAKPAPVGQQPSTRGAPAYPEQLPGKSIVPGTESGHVQKVMAAEATATEKARAAADKLHAEQQQQEAIERQIIEEGLIPGAPSISESIGPGGVGKLSSRTPYEAPDAVKAPKAQGVTRADQLSGNIGLDKKIEEIVAKQTAPFTPAPASTSVLANFFKGPVDVAGQNYRAAKAVAGENPLAARQAGVALNAEAARAGLPTRGSTNLAKFLGEKVSPEISGATAVTSGPVAPKMVNPSGTGSARGANYLDDLKASAEAQQPAAAAPQAADWQQEELDYIAKEIARRKGITDEQGLSQLRLMLGLTGTGLGAVGGAALADEEDRGKGALAGAALGGAVGFGAPSVVNALRKPGALEIIPKWQRSSMLTSSPHGLAANTFAGPWGSGVVMALEKGLSGDRRGWTLLREMLRPMKLGQKWLDKLPEAERSIGRAEGTGLGMRPSLGQRVLASPGTGMTAGDMTIKDAIQESGFSSEQARRATLTSEPELFAFKKVADFGKGTPKNPNDITKLGLEMAFPFRRTPANIGEQGALRFPVLGSFFQKMRAQPDPVREQVIQQLMNAGIGVGSYGLGTQLDPETARIVRRYVSNLAGPHSAMASAGFAMGQAKRAGRDKLSGKTYQEFADMLPLPTHQAPMDWLKFGGGLAKGELNIPRGMIPGSGIKNVGFSPFEEETPAVGGGSIYKLRKP